MKLSALEGRKEDYLFRATIVADKLQIEDVRCKVYLPLKFPDPVILYFHLTENQTQIIKANWSDLWKFSIHGELKGGSNFKTRIEADNVYSTRINSKNWGDITDTVFVAQPLDLKTINSITPDPSDPPFKAGGNFWLTTHKLLGPALIVGHGYDGNVTVETLHPITFTLVNGLQLTFKRHFQRHENADGEDVTSSHLVAEFDLESVPSAAAQVDDRVTRCLDDFLLIASFAARQRSIWYGWETFDAESHAKFYRRNVAIPNNKKQKRIEDGLISRADFEEFLKVAYSTFIECEPKDLLRQALNYTIPQERQTVNSKFITLYSALETLVLYFRRKNNLETVFSPEEEDHWKQLRRDFKRWLKEESVLKGDENKSKQRLIGRNLSALNRVAFGVAFNKCCNFYSVNLQDLWPIPNNTTAAEVWSLSEIRNKLVHGESLNEPQLQSLIPARYHLQWAVERLILAVLGWDISRSNVSSDRLHNNSIYQNWEIDSRVISG